MSIRSAITPRRAAHVSHGDELRGADVGAVEPLHLAEHVAHGVEGRVVVDLRALHTVDRQQKPLDRIARQQVEPGFARLGQRAGLGRVDELGAALHR